MAGTALVLSSVLLVGMVAAAYAVSQQEPAWQDPECGALQQFPTIGLACFDKDVGMYRVYSDTLTFLGTTHGADPAPKDLAEAVSSGSYGGPTEPIDKDGMLPYMPSDPFCANLQKSPYHIQVILARASDDGPDANTPTADDLRQLVRHANGVLRAEGAQYGVTPIDYRVKCEAGGTIDVDEVTLGTSKGAATFSTISGELNALGYNDGKVKYWIYYDEYDNGGAGGVGNLYLDDSAGAGNANNGNAGPMYSVTFGYYSIRIMMHELGHNMGAVQNSAPQATGPGDAHCWDGRSIMCYMDKGVKGGLYNELACPGPQPYDCNGDDFFHPDPAPGTYLYNFWNQGDKANRFLHFPNKVPVAYGQGLVTQEGTAVAVVLNGIDPDVQPEPLVYAVATPPAKGTLTGTPPQLTYTPTDPEWTGIDSFTFHANDGEDNSLPGTVQVTVQAVNDPPVPQPLFFTTLEEAPVEVPLVAVDPDSEDVTFLPAAPTPGTLSGTGAVRTYHPPANFNGIATFAYGAHDGVDPSDPTKPGLVTIQVLPVNDPPQANDITLYTLEDQPVTFQLAPGDVDGDPVTVTLGAVGIGQLGGNLPTLTYTPPPGFHGTVSFPYTASDQQVSVTALVKVIVGEINDPPVAHSASLVVHAPVPVVLSGSDPEGQPLSYSILQLPADGSIAGTAPDLQYTPSGCGQSTLLFRVSDGQLWSAPATVTFDLNCAPTAMPLTAELPEDGRRSLTLAGSDPDGDALRFEVQQLPQRGRLVGKAPALEYVPEPDRCGTDSFTYRAHDLFQASPPALVTLVVACTQDPPVAHDEQVTLREGTSASVVLRGRDVDGDPLTFELQHVPAGLQVQGTPPSLQVTAASVGTYLLPFRVKDTADAFAEALVTVVAVPDRAPDARNAVHGVVQGQSITVGLPGGDTDSTLVQYTLTQRGTRGAVEHDEAVITYTAPTAFSGVETVGFEVMSGEQTATGAVTFVVVKDLACEPPMLTVGEDGRLAFAPFVPLPKALSPVAALTSPPSRGDLIVQSSTEWVYLPHPDSFGTDRFAYSVRGTNLVTEACVATIQVTPRNDPPYVQAPALPDMDENLPEQVFPNFVSRFHPGAASEQDQRILSATVIAEPPGSATASIDQTGALRLKTADDWSGLLTLLVTVRDTGGNADGGRDATQFASELRVRPVEDPPRTQDDTLTIRHGEGDGFVAVLSNDRDPEGRPLTLVSAGPAQGKAAAEANAIRYTPAPGFTGEDRVPYTVSDGVRTSTGYLVVTVEAAGSPDAAQAPAAEPGADADGDDGVGATWWIAGALLAVAALAVGAWAAIRRRA